jgi:O-antigen/teichoic acid export membrane protein
MFANWAKKSYNFYCMVENTIAKNTSYLTLSYIAQKVLSFFYFVLLARFLGVEDLGKYTFAMSFTTMFAVFIDIGLTQSLIREIARRFEKINEYLSSIIWVKVGLSVVVYLVICGLINIMGYPPITRTLVYLSGLVMVMDSFTLTFWGVFRGNRNLFYEALSIIINQIVVVACGLLVLFMKWPLPALMLPFIIGGAFNFIFSWALNVRRFKFRLQWRFDRQVIYMLLKAAIPFALIAIFSRIYGNIDSVMLSYMLGDSGDRAVGLYATAMKIPFALQFIPSAFAAAVFPAFSHLFANDKGALKNAFDKSMLFLTIAVVPIAFGIYSIAQTAIVSFFGIEFLPAAAPLRILVFSLIFVFLNFPLGSLLNGCNKQITNSIIIGITMVGSVIANWIVIPRYSYLGSAWVFFGCQLFVFIVSLIVARKIIPYSRRNLLAVFTRTIVASVVMIIFINYFQTRWNLFLIIGVAAVIYLFVLYLLRGFRSEDIKYLLQNFKRSA